MPMYKPTTGVRLYVYSRLTLVVAFWKASHISPNIKFSYFLTLCLVLHIPKAFPICEKMSEIFFEKYMRVKLKNLFPSLKSCHTFFGFHRVYGMQNDRLDLTVNEFFTVWKMMLCSQRYFQFFEFFHGFSFYILQNISVVLNTINPMNSKKLVTTFSWIFHVCS